MIPPPPPPPKSSAFCLDGRSVPPLVKPYETFDTGIRVVSPVTIGSPIIVETSTISRIFSRVFSIILFTGVSFITLSPLKKIIYF